MDEAVLEASEPIFYTPLLQFTVPAAGELNARLVDEIEAIRAASPGVTRSNQNGWHSDVDFFERPEPGCSSLKRLLVDALRKATLQVAPRFDFSAKLLQVEGWINVSGRGAYNVPHDHPGYAWSGSYYVQVPTASGRGGAIEFLDSRTNVGVVGIEGAACYLGKVRLQPRAGQILIFPSYLRHWVYPNEDEQDRISIAFNGRFIPRPTSGRAAAA